MSEVEPKPILMSENKQEEDKNEKKAKDKCESTNDTQEMLLETMNTMKKKMGVMIQDSDLSIVLICLFTLLFVGALCGVCLFSKFQGNSNSQTNNKSGNMSFVSPNLGNRFKSI